MADGEPLAAHVARGVRQVVPRVALERRVGVPRAELRVAERGAVGAGAGGRGCREGRAGDDDDSQQRAGSGRGGGGHRGFVPFRSGSLSARSRIRAGRRAAVRCLAGAPGGLRGGGRGGRRGGRVGGGRPEAGAGESGRRRRLFPDALASRGRRLGSSARRLGAGRGCVDGGRSRGAVTAAPLLVRGSRFMPGGGGDAGRRRGCRGQPDVRLQRRRLGPPDQARQPDQRESAADHRRRRAWRRSASGFEVGCPSRSYNPGGCDRAPAATRPDTASAPLSAGQNAPL